MIILKAMRIIQNNNKRKKKIKIQKITKWMKKKKKIMKKNKQTEFLLKNKKMITIFLTINKTFLKNYQKNHQLSITQTIMLKKYFQKLKINLIKNLRSS